MILIAVDPGQSGAIAEFWCNGAGQLVMVWDMPLTPAELAPHLPSVVPGEDKWSKDRIQRRAIIEAVHAMPKVGSIAGFKLGYNVGWVEGVLAAHGFTVERVAPSRWKRHFGLSADKEAARKLAQERFPALAGQLTRKKDHGRAEALLIGLWAQEQKGKE